MSLCCKHHLLCLGLGADCAPPIVVEQTFNGDVQRKIVCVDTRPETIHTALDAVVPAGDGWNVQLRGSADSLEAIGAFRNEGGWVFEDPSGMMWGCKVSR